MDQVLLEEHHFVHLLLGFVVFLTLDRQQLAAVLQLELATVLRTLQLPFIVLQHHYLRLVLLLR